MKKRKYTKKENKGYITPADVAKLISVATVTIFRACKSGKLKTKRTPGGHFRIDIKDLENYLVSLGYDKKILENICKK